MHVRVDLDSLQMDEVVRDVRALEALGVPRARELGAPRLGARDAGVGPAREEVVGDDGGRAIDAPERERAEAPFERDTAARGLGSVRAALADLPDAAEARVVEAR